MIASVAYTAASPSTAVAITMDDGQVWHTDASLPADTDIRRQLAEWIAAGGVIAPFSVPDAVEPVPQVISDRQFFQQLAVLGIITKDEALAAMKAGAIPEALQAFVAAIEDDEQRFAVEMLLSGAIEFRRDHPVTAAVAAAQMPPWTSAEVDDFFRDAAAL